MILSYLGFALVAWLLVGLITGIAEMLLVPKEFLLDFCRKQKGYRELQIYLTDNAIYNIMRMAIVIVCTLIGLAAIPHYYKIVKDVSKHKEKRNS